MFLFRSIILIYAYLLLATFKPATPSITTDTAPSLKAGTAEIQPLDAGQDAAPQIFTVETFFFELPVFVSEEAVQQVSLAKRGAHYFGYSGLSPPVILA